MKTLKLGRVQDHLLCMGRKLEAEIHNKVSRGNTLRVQGHHTTTEHKVPSKPVIATIIRHRTALTQQICSNEACPRLS